MSEPQKELLIEVEEYLKSGIHIGTKFKNKYMQDFIYKVRPDGLSIMNLETIDERLRIMIDFLSRYAPEEILVVSRRENSHRAVKPDVNNYSLFQKGVIEYGEQPNRACN